MLPDLARKIAVPVLVITSQTINSVHFVRRAWQTKNRLFQFTHLTPGKVAMLAAILAASCGSASGAWRATGPFGGDAEVIRAIPKVRDMVVAAAPNGPLSPNPEGGA